MDLRNAVRVAGESVNVALTASQQTLLARYVELVLKWNRITNLIGVDSADEFIAKHLADCLSVLSFIPETTLADLGSGAGLPGLVLACVRPGLFVSLVEPRAKRARFLAQACISLGLSNVEVIPFRVEAWQPARRPDGIICRAFGSISSFVQVTRALQAPGTQLFAMKGQDPADEVRALAGYGMDCQIHELNVVGWRSRHLVVLTCP